MRRRALKGAWLAALVCSGWAMTGQSAMSRSVLRPPNQLTTFSATLPRDQVSTGNMEADRAWNEGSYARSEVVSGSFSAPDTCRC